MATDRYSTITAAEDLGGLEMFPDHTEDLRTKNGPGSAPTLNPGASVPTNHYEGEEHRERTQHH